MEGFYRLNPFSMRLPINSPILLFLIRVISLAALVCSATGSVAPNIVVFLSDDMHWHHPGFNGGLADTPNLDRLAKQGTHLTQFYVNSVCSPTRASFLTGRYPFRNGMEERSHGNDLAGMLLDERTLGQALGDAGYYTAIIGKWHLGNWYKHHLPMQRGFDYQYGLYGALIGYYGKARERFYDWHRNEQTIKPDGYSTDLIGQECVSLIKQHDVKKPLFMYVPFNAIHGPYEPPPETEKKYLKRIQGKSPDNPYSGFKGIDAIKFSMLESLDAAVGRTIAALDEKGMLDNTLVIFFNDNGGVRTNPPYRGGKSQNYEGGVRVPCIIWWPGKVPANNKVNELVHVTDLYPTLINIAGGSLDQVLPIDGLDVWDVITRGAPSARTEVVYSLQDGFGDTGAAAIRMGEYKMVGNELFNIEKDPYETTDLTNSHPKVFQSLQDRLNQLVKERRTPEKHSRISDTIDHPLLVLGKEENENPPDWLAGYVRSLPVTKKEEQRSAKEE